MWVACVEYFQPPEISQRYAIEVVIDHSTGLQRVICIPSLNLIGLNLSMMKPYLYNIIA